LLLKPRALSTLRRWASIYLAATVADEQAVQIQFNSPAPTMLLQEVRAEERTTLSKLCSTRLGL